MFSFNLRYRHEIGVQLYVFTFDEGDNKGVSGRIALIMVKRYLELQKYFITSKVALLVSLLQFFV